MRIRGQEISLTAKEFDILALLVANPNRVFTYEMIVNLEDKTRILPIGRFKGTKDDFRNFRYK